MSTSMAIPPTQGILFRRKKATSGNNIRKLLQENRRKASWHKTITYNVQWLAFAAACEKLGLGAAAHELESCARIAQEAADAYNNRTEEHTKLMFEVALGYGDAFGKCHSIITNLPNYLHTQITAEARESLLTSVEICAANYGLDQLDAEHIRKESFEDLAYLKCNQHDFR